MGQYADQIVELVGQMKSISGQDYVRIVSQLETLRTKTREEELRQEVREVGFPWQDISSTEKRTTISPNFGLTAYPVLVRQILDGRWTYRIEDDKGTVLVDNQGPGREGFDWDTCQVLIARFSTAIQTY